MIGVDAGNAVTPVRAPFDPWPGTCPTTVDITKAQFPTLYDCESVSKAGTSRIDTKGI